MSNLGRRFLDKDIFSSMLCKNHDLDLKVCYYVKSFNLISSL